MDGRAIHFAPATNCRLRFSFCCCRRGLLYIRRWRSASAGVRLIKPMETPDSSIKRISTRHDVLSAILWLQSTGEKKIRKNCNANTRELGL